MKNFIFAMCGFLMMSLVSLSVQASSVESPKCEYVNPSVDVGLPDIQFITLEICKDGSCLVIEQGHISYSQAQPKTEVEPVVQVIPSKK